MTSDRFTISATALTGCLRGFYFQKKKAPLPLIHPEVSDILQLFGRLQEKGRVIQKRLTDEWLQKGYLVGKPDSYIPFNNYDITGKYDAICKIDDRFWLIEIKGVSTDYLAHAKETGLLRAEHKIQTMIYHHFLKPNFGELIPIVYYVDRNTNESAKLKLSYSEEEIEEQLEKAQMVKRALEEDKPPDAAETIIFNQVTKKHDINIAAITCKYHGLCLEDEYWYVKAKQELDK